MLTAVLGLEIIALSFIFLLASIWSEENARFGYVLVPLLTGFFWWAGFLPFAYLTTVIPLLIFMGIIGFMRAQLKLKWGFGGSGGGILFKLVFFLIMLQMSIGYVNSMGIFVDNLAATPANDYTVYNISSAQNAFGDSSNTMGAIDVLTNGLQMAWMLFRVLWNMLASVFFIYPTLVTTFGIPASLSLILQCGIYVIYGLELINMVFKPARSIEV